LAIKEIRAWLALPLSGGAVTRTWRTTLPSARVLPPSIASRDDLGVRRTLIRKTYHSLQNLKAGRDQVVPDTSALL
jgi:hypothetical protein